MGKIGRRKAEKGMYQRDEDWRDKILVERSAKEKRQDTERWIGGVASFLVQASPERLDPVAAAPVIVVVVAHVLDQDSRSQVSVLSWRRRSEGDARENGEGLYSELLSGQRI